MIINKKSTDSNFYKPWIIIGSGGHAHSVLECLISNKYSIAGILDIHFKGQEETIIGFPVIGGKDILADQFHPDDYNIALAIGDNQLRSELFEELREEGYSFPHLVHSTAILGTSVHLSSGVMIAQGCIINASVSIEKNSIINTGVIIDHETIIGANSHIGPGVKIAGRVIIGDYCIIGIGSAIIDKIHIGDHTTIGAGSVVVNNLPKSCIAVGIPCRIME